MAQATSTIDEQNATLVKSVDTIQVWRHITTYLQNAGSNDMAVDGSGGAPQTFSYTPPANYDFVASRMIILLVTATAMSITDFGDLAALIQGVEIKANGVLITTWRDNLDIYTEFYDKLSLGNVSDAAADTTMLGRWTFTKDTNGNGIYVPNGSTFDVIINDDLSGLSQFRMKLKGKLAQAQ